MKLIGFTDNNYISTWLLCIKNTFILLVLLQIFYLIHMIDKYASHNWFMLGILHAIQICLECSSAARAAGGQQWARAAVPVSGSFWAESIFNSQSRWSQKLKRAWSDLRGDGRSHAGARMIRFTVMIWSQSTYQLQTWPVNPRSDRPEESAEFLYWSAAASSSSRR